MGKQTSIIARTLLIFIATFTLSASSFAQGDNAQGAQAGGEQPESLFHTAEHTENLSIFFRAVKAAGLADTLKGAGPFTVFAPTDEAFAKLPPEMLEELFRPQHKEKLRELLIAHVYATRATAAQIQNLKTAVTLKRRAHAVETGEGIKIGGASVTRYDIIAANGVLHLIDRVILPADND